MPGLLEDRRDLGIGHEVRPLVHSKSAHTRFSSVGSRNAVRPQPCSARSHPWCRTPAIRRRSRRSWLPGSSVSPCVGSHSISSPAGRRACGHCRERPWPGVGNLPFPLGSSTRRSARSLAIADRADLSRRRRGPGPDAWPPSVPPPRGWRRRAARVDVLDVVAVRDNEQLVRDLGRGAAARDEAQAPSRLAATEAAGPRSAGPRGGVAAGGVDLLTGVTRRRR